MWQFSIDAEIRKERKENLLRKTQEYEKNCLHQRNEQKNGTTIHCEAKISSSFFLIHTTAEVILRIAFSQRIQRGKRLFVYAAEEKNGRKRNTFCQFTRKTPAQVPDMWAWVRFTYMWGNEWKSAKETAKEARKKTMTKILDKCELRACTWVYLFSTKNQERRRESILMHTYYYYCMNGIFSLFELCMFRIRLP